MKRLQKNKRQALWMLLVTVLLTAAAYCIGFPVRDTPEALTAAAQNAFTDHKGEKIAAGAEIVETVRVGREMVLVCRRDGDQGDVILHRGLLGNFLTFNTTGLDFALTALFVVLFLEQVNKKENRAAGAVGIAATVVSLVLFGADNLVIPAMVLILVVALLGKNKLGGNKTCH